MKIIYRGTALSDLAQIADYFGSYSELTLERAHTDIDYSIGLLKTHPRLGRQLDDGSRLIVSKNYRFNITYDVGSDRIEIVGIYRYQNR